MDVADWLRTLGLEQYEAAFHENSVSIDLLPNLTAENLRDLGITAVDHRRQLLDAITALRSSAEIAGDLRNGVPPAGAGNDDPDRVPRRQVSAMFCNVMDPQSSRLDLEDLSAAI